MTPGLLLLTCVLLTVAAAAADVAVHRRRSRGLRALASQWGMNYHPADQLRLTPKVLPPRCCRVSPSPAPPTSA
jgi:hypothetical protein